AEERLAGVLGAVPFAALGGAAHGGDEAARLVGEQALEVGGLGEVVEADLDEAGALLGGLLDFGLHHLVPRAADDDADVLERRGHDSPSAGPTGPGATFTVTAGGGRRKRRAAARRMA